MFQVINVFCFDFTMSVFLDLIDELNALADVLILIMFVYHVLKVGIKFASSFLIHV